MFLHELLHVSGLVLSFVFGKICSKGGYSYSPSNVWKKKMKIKKKKNVRKLNEKVKNEEKEEGYAYPSSSSFFFNHEILLYCPFSVLRKSFFFSLVFKWERRLRTETSMV